jgi:hypothetical protein
MVNIKEMENKTEKKKSIFLNSIEKIIKTILLKCNDLLNYEKIYTTNLDNNNKDIPKNNFILRILKYPFINKINDFESQLNFLKQLDENLKDCHDTNIDINNSFYISKLNKQLIMVLENIFIDEKYNLFREILKVLEYNVYNYNDDFDFADENDGNYFFNNNNNSFYESLECTNLSNDIQSEDENYEYALNKYNKNKNKYVEDFEKLKNEFYFVINLFQRKILIIVKQKFKLF